MKNVLILSFSELLRDPRVMREVYALKDGYSVTVCGWGKAPDLNVKFVQADETRPGLFGKVFCMTMMFLRFHKMFYWGFKRHRLTKKRLKGISCDVVLANDLDAMPIAVWLAEKCGATLVADMHEYFPGQSQSSANMIAKMFARYNLRMCYRYIPRADACITVSEGIAKKYHADLGVQFEVVVNAPDYVDLNPTPVDPESIRLIHHGNAAPQRNILGLINVAMKLDRRFSLDLALVGDTESRYYKLIADAVRKSNGKVRLIDPFPMEQISESINAYDLGIYALNPDRDNHLLALPNKLFEWIQARLGVVTWPLPEMKRIVDVYKIGVTSKEYTVESMVEALNSLAVEQIVMFKKNADKAALHLHAGKNVEVIRKCVLFALSK